MACSSRSSTPNSSAISLTFASSWPNGWAATAGCCCCCCCCCCCMGFSDRGRGYAGNEVDTEPGEGPMDLPSFLWRWLSWWDGILPTDGWFIRDVDDVVEVDADDARGEKLKLSPRLWPLLVLPLVED